MIRIHRRLRTLLAAGFLLFGWTGDALGWHACPHHSHVPGIPAEAAAPGGHEADHANGSAAHGGAHAAPRHDGGDRDHGPDHGEHGACTCLGGCPAATAVGLPGTGPGGLRAPPAEVATPLAALPASLPARLLPYVLPYGLAPPAAA